MELVEEKVILKNLIHNEKYFNKCFPFLEANYFLEKHCKKIFGYISSYYKKYNSIPKIDAISVMEDKDGLNQIEHDECIKVISYIKDYEEQEDFDWLSDMTEEFIKHRIYYNSILDAASLYQNKGSIDATLPEKISDALSVSFDTHIGMDFDEAAIRWEMYNNEENKIPFLIDSMNVITKGGLTKKTLNCLMSSNTGGFKSGTMCSLSVDYIKQGYNVLYLSFEMSEDKIMERIDANMLDVPIDNLKSIPKEQFVNKVNAIIKKTQGRLVVKQFPTSTCNVGHIRYLLDDLKLKKKFVPDIIFFDYLGIMSSIKYKTGSSTAPEHILLKSICEEVRGLCVERDIIGWTAMQSNRNGASAGDDLSISDISASYSSIFGYDLLLGIITTPEHDQNHRMVIKQLKNRYSDINFLSTFRVSVDKNKMRVTDYINPQTGISDIPEMPIRQEVIAQNDEAERSVFSSNLLINRGNSRMARRISSNLKV